MTKNFTILIGLLVLSINLGCQNGNSSQNGAQSDTSQAGKKDGKDSPEIIQDKPSQSGNGSSSGIKSGGEQQSHKELIQKAKNQEPGNTNDSVNFILQGEVTGGANSEVILDKMGIGINVTPLASTVVNQQDRFRFGGKIPGPGLYQIRFPSQSIHIILTGGIMNIKTDIDNLNDYKVEGDGAEDTRLIRKLYQVMNRYNTMGDSLKKVLKKTDNTQKRLEIHDKMNKINKKKRRKKFQDIKALVKKAWDKNSIAAPVIAVRTELHRDLDFFRNLLEDYKKQYPNNTFVGALEDKLRKTEKYLENNPEEKKKWTD